MDASRRFWEFPVGVATLKGHTLELNQADLTFQSGNEALMDLVVKLNAETARLKRLLADELPEGFEWEYETQMSEDTMQNTVKYRVVARLRATL